MTMLVLVSLLIVAGLIYLSAAQLFAGFIAAIIFIGDLIIAGSGALLTFVLQFCIRIKRLAVRAKQFVQSES
ncbi:hypothetical protein MK904_01240 [Loigolactobacillus coryniformis]|uniref:Uncharacterized protein n=1 Tax=Loigolactobacillus coryniformis subsp. torquens DSM 20004 = KCTC 3535 TaxID=1423822 RepID=A0A2D1KQW0_9LACO|nr:hypothetical protein [Loigolactobacillus coryniformis]ATO44528.1 hypothetical protein LC20004_11725 [Loigolactobacillus coryniformis subsp. torquens DSM 20004 = KCTC 3535]KRK85230.1 hypothetical protein FC16_GL002612 [Loigolactobacillus coryniformis subsp. torquens DSM 20004 = KCTC 3535]MBW4803273.1 hypothetical protein [Loigolactobacillus coryniformis subsp. torquens]MBW4805969.1 hypothetical protein [Loigolactobacillus coryniformis subsp. torquens]MCL5458021.1 hypothetical protein [Loigol